MKTKILLVLHTPPPFGGGEIQAQNINDYFREKDNCYIYDYSRKNHSRADWKKKFNIRAFIAGIIWIIKVSYLLFRHRPAKVYFTLPKSFGGFMRNACVIPVARTTGTKILGELPGTSFLFLDQHKSFTCKVGLFFLRQIDEIRFLSPGISELHSGYKFKKHVIIENGISATEITQINKAVFSQPVLNLLYVGSIESSKGVFNILYALKICNSKKCKLHFNFVGYWPDKKEEIKARHYIEVNGLGEMIEFHGILTGGGKWDIFNRSAILVHPTFWDGVPLTILEALAVGIPVISTKVGGIPDTIQNGVNGTILPENNPEELSKAIMHYYDNRNELLTISENNKTLFKERFELSIFLKNMEEWFNS